MIKTGTDPSVAFPSVLLVDDDEYLRDVLARMLTSLGVREIHQAESASVALGTLRQLTATARIVISDLEMPTTDGMEFLRRLSQEHPGTSVLILSGKEPGILRSVELMAREYGLNVLGVLPKPATLPALRDILSAYQPRAAAVVAGEPVAPARWDLARAIVRREFVVFLQPKVDLSSGEVMGAEALARWMHPTRGILPPSGFVPAAEAEGLVEPLTLALIEDASAAMSGWPAAMSTLTVSINVSHTSLADTGFAGQLLGVLSKYGLPAHRLIIEVTETVAMTQLAPCLETLTRLRMHGTGLSIDDFGTGHASFQQLSRVPFTELKIDRSFVSGAGRDPVRRTFLESSLQIAGDLRLNSVAEGVETLEDWELLRQLGCDAAQGFFIARPMEAARFPEWVERWRMNRGRPF